MRQPKLTGLFGFFGYLQIWLVLTFQSQRGIWRIILNMPPDAFKTTFSVQITAEGFSHTPPKE